MARCLISNIDASRDLETGCGILLLCSLFCSCESNTGPDNPRNIETDEEGSYAERLERRRAWVDYLSKNDG